MSTGFHQKPFFSRSGFLLWWLVSGGVVLTASLFWGQQILPIASVFAQQIESHTSNLGVNTQLNQSSETFSLDSIMDFVGGNSSPSASTTGLNAMHGYHLLDDEDNEVKITKIVAVPENRYPGLNNNHTFFLLEILPANTQYRDDLVIWSNRLLIAGGGNHQTDQRGVWVGDYVISLPAGNYDFYLTGYSHLRKKISNFNLQDPPVGNELYFTYDEATIDSMKQSGTLLSTDPMFPLLAGDAGVAEDADNSCGPLISDCVSGGTFSGDEWGDNEVNSLDLSSVLTKLYNNVATDIMKEDLNMDGEINSLDLSMTLNNLYMAGDK